MPFGRKKELPILKKLKKMKGDIDKGKNPKIPETNSRQVLITEVFVEELGAIGLEPSSDSGYIPSSQTPLAKYLRRFGVADDIIDAIIAGLADDESAESVRMVIDAAADTPDIDLQGEYLTRAKDIAVEEWEKRRQIDSI